MTNFILLYSSIMQIKIFKPVDHFVKALVYGASWVGKTVFWGTAPKPIFASAENGLLSLWNKEIPFVDIRTIKDLEDLLEYLKTNENGYETVIIDSITEINEIIKSEIEKKTGKTMQLQDWWVLSKKIRALLSEFKNLKMHVLLIAQEQIERDGDVVTKVLPSLNGRSATEIASVMDVVWYVFVDKAWQRHITTSTDARLITKDRTNCIGNDTDVDFNVWVQKAKWLKVGDQETVVNTETPVETKPVSVDETPVVVDPVVETPTTEKEKEAEKIDDLFSNPPTDDDENVKDETPEVIETVKPQETVQEVATNGETNTQEWKKRLSVNKVKQLQITWKKFAEINGWNAVDSDKKRRATMQKYFDVDSANLLSEEQANDFITRIESATEKLAK